MSKFDTKKRPKHLKRINNQRNESITGSATADVIFSFKYLKEDEDFHINHSEIAYLQTAIRRFRDICAMTKLSLVTNRSGALKSHRIDWADERVSRDSFEIPNQDDLCAEAYQFTLSVNENGRIIGFFTGDNIFNVVWFDKDHKLYP